MLSTDRILEAANFDFKGKRILITGASGGIGLAAIRKLLDSGATVYSNSRRVIDIQSDSLVQFNEDLSEEDNI